MVRWVLAALLSLFLALLFLPFTVNVHGSISLEAQDITARIRHPLVPFYIKMPNIGNTRGLKTGKKSLPTKPPHQKKSVRVALDTLKNVVKLGFGVMGKIGKTTTVKTFRLTLILGTGDAASTALWCGSIAAFFSVFKRFFRKKMVHKEEPSLFVKPRYDMVEFKLFFNISVSSSIAKMLSATLNLYRMHLAESNNTRCEKTIFHTGVETHGPSH
jgi:hypothetical protein